MLAKLSLEQTLEVVVYTLSSRMPVYYRTFSGNMPDFRRLGVIKKGKNLDYQVTSLKCGVFFFCGYVMSVKNQLFF